MRPQKARMHNGSTGRSSQHPAQERLQSTSLTQAFRNLAKLDAGAAWRRACWPVILFLALFVVVAFAVVDQFPLVDELNIAINTAVHGMRDASDAFDSFVIVLTTLGDFLPMACVCLLICVVLALRKEWDSVAFFAVNVPLAAVCVQVLKRVFAVPRPGDMTLVSLPGSFSFPSAHSFCSLVAFGMVGLLIFRALSVRGIARNKALVPGIILALLALLIGVSRIYVGVHWPVDVLGGWLLGGAWLVFAGSLYMVGAIRVDEETSDR